MGGSVHIQIVANFSTTVIDTGGKITTSVVDTGGKFYTANIQMTW
jgi:hypothetical protein